MTTSAMVDEKSQARNKPQPGQLVAALGLHRQNDLPAAEKIYRQLLCDDPHDFDILHLLGLALAQSGRPESGLPFIDRALAIRPDFAEAHNNRGLALKGLNRFDEALAAYDKALALKPGYAEAHTNRGNLLRELKRYDEALQSLDMALLANPGSAQAHNDRGLALQALRRVEEAVASIDKALAINPAYAEAHNNRGLALWDLLRLEEALAAFDKALAVRPDYPEAMVNRSMLLLLRGDFARGLPGYESRWNIKGKMAPKAEFPCPAWRGEHLTGKKIVVHEEQGIGDVLQFCRYLRLLEERGAQVTFLVRRNLVALLQPLSKAVQLRSTYSSHEVFDYHANLLSLPLGFGTTLDSIPQDTPYLSAEPARIARWRSRLGERGFKVGIAWQGSSQGTELGRSFPVGVFHGLSRLPGIRLISLQKYGGAEQLSALPAGMQIESLGEDFDAGDDAFLDTAAVMANLDLVISADTSIAHLAGALGRPVWVALKQVPDWRWLLARADSPWYPTMRLFRQRAMDDWRGVFDEIENALSQALMAESKGDKLAHALALHKNGDSSRAKAIYREILIQDPMHLDALHFLGVLFAQTQRPARALEFLDRALKLRPDHPEALANRGNVLWRLERLEEALESYHKALAIRPDFVDALCNCATALQASNRWDEALRHLDRALAIMPDHVEALSARGMALKALDRLDEALACFDKVIDLKPDFAEAHNIRGIVLKGLRQLDTALHSYEKALRIDPGYAEAHSNRGNVLNELRRFDEALVSYDRALAIRPEFAEAYANRGLVLQELKRFDEALACFDRALAIRPDYADCTLSRSLLVMLMGDLAGGWPGYESRWQGVKPLRRKLLAPLPAWRGEPLMGKKIIVYEEQGLGDILQFCRYVPLLAERGARVTFLVRASLVTLLHPLAKAARITATYPAAEALDYQSALMSLPHGFGTTLGNIPGQTPYLSADPERVEKWRSKLGAQGFKIGIAWQGSKLGKELGKSFALRAFRNIARLQGVRLISLQKNDGIDQLRDLPDGMQVETLGDAFDAGEDAFLDTAAVMENLDLIISTDTSIAHLAGALGRPVWVALKSVPDWRWLLDRPDSPWYPTMRLFRQGKPDDWNGVFTDIEIALRNLRDPQAARNDLATGIAWHKKGDFSRAEQCYQRMLAEQPGNAEALHLLGVIWGQTGRPEGARAFIDRALALRPDNAEALNDRGLILQELKRFEEALASINKALAIRPNYAQALYNRGNILRDLKCFQDAAASFDKALQIDPDYAEAHHNLGLTLQELMRFEDALSAFGKALSLQPGNADLIFNRSLLVLLMGDLASGWKGYESRWHTRKRLLRRLDANFPLWQGEPLAGRTIIVHEEQGLGDTLQFCRYLPLLAARGARVTFLARPSLVALLRPLGETVRILSACPSDAIFDYQSPLLSLPRALGTTLDSIPRASPYLRADPARVRRWRSRLGTRGFKIGIAWQGSSEGTRLGKSFALSTFLGVSRLPGVRLISLQKNDGADQLRDLPQGMAVETLGADFDAGNDAFLDTAAVMENLDLVISTDTSIAHLAGALGRPVWVALKHVPDWRWLLERSDTPWYPTMRLFRQQASDDWRGVFLAIEAALRTLMPGRRDGGQAKLQGVAELLAQAVAHQKRGDLRQAEQACHTVLAVDAGHVDALHLLSVVLIQTKRWQAGVERIDKLLTLKPEHADAHYNRGLALQALERLEEALASYRTALALRPDYVAALSNAGVVLQELKRPDEALSCYDKALAIAPADFGALYNRGNTLLQLDRLDEALACYDRALAIQPGNAGVHFNRGNAFKKAKRFDEALACYDQALAIAPDFPEVLNNRGLVLLDMQRADEALACLDRALAARPDYAVALNNRGLTLKEMQRHDEALASYDKAIALSPGYADAIANRAHTALLTGDFAAGWGDYEFRWQRKTARGKSLTAPFPTWRGEAVQGARMIIHEEQGIGDVFQFSRYLKLLADGGAHVTFLVRPGLVALLRTISPAVRVLATCPSDEVFHYQSALLSLPRGFKTDLQSIPAAPRYLHAEPERVRRWKVRLAGPGFKIGIAWHGSKDGAELGKSFAVDTFLGVSRLPGVRLISLQKYDGAEQLNALPAGMQVETLGEDFDAGDDAFLDTAAVMENLDLVISTDTSIAHLAGALGRPVWVALKQVPDWRWLLERPDSPWYPTMRLFRQRARGDWQSVFSAIEAALIADMPRTSSPP